MAPASGACLRSAKLTLIATMLGPFMSQRTKLLTQCTALHTVKVIGTAGVVLTSLSGWSASHCDNNFARCDKGPQH